MKNNIQNWQTYDSTNIHELKGHNIILNKLIHLGKIFLIGHIICIFVLIAYMLYKDNFDFVLVSDGSEQICFFDKELIKSVR